MTGISAMRLIVMRLAGLVAMDFQPTRVFSPRTNTCGDRSGDGDRRRARFETFISGFFVALLRPGVKRKKTPR